MAFLTPIFLLGALAAAVPVLVHLVRRTRARKEPFGVHPFLRLAPPRRALGSLEPEHILFGHGEGFHGPQAGPALSEALATARRRLPQAWLGGLRKMPR